MLNLDYFSSLLPTLILQLDQNKGLQSLSIKAKLKGNTRNAADLCSAVGWPVHTQLGETRKDVLLQPRAASSDPPGTSLHQQLLLWACTLQVWAARESTEPFQQCHGCPSPVASSVTTNRPWTTLHPWAQLLCSHWDSWQVFRDTHQEKHLQGNATCKTTLMQSVYSWYSHNQSKCSVNTHNIVYKQIMGLGFADICAVVGNAKATLNNWRNLQIKLHRYTQNKAKIHSAKVLCTCFFLLLAQYPFSWHIITWYHLYLKNY